MAKNERLNDLFSNFNQPSGTSNEGSVEFSLVGRGKGPFREKYRPQKIDEVVPTCSKELLRNQIGNPNSSQIYLFEGKTGTGKTTCARILARALVCLDNNNFNKPCLECANCVSFKKTFDKIEVNAADKNKVDDIRSLVSSMKYMPTSFAKKIYILDEVQRLTPDAQQVLLTELEEPYPYLLIFLCTTDITKINKALVDRSCRVTFDSIKTKHAKIVIDQICGLENLSLPEDDETRSQLVEALYLQSNGSVRALLNNLEKFRDKGFDIRHQDDETPAEVKTLFKAIKSADWSVLSSHLKNPNVRKDPEGLRRGLESYLRGVMLNTDNFDDALRLGNALLKISDTLLKETSSTTMYNMFVLKCLRASAAFRS